MRILNINIKCTYVGILEPEPNHLGLQPMAESFHHTLNVFMQSDIVKSLKQNIVTIYKMYFLQGCWLGVSMNFIQMGHSNH